MTSTDGEGDMHPIDENPAEGDDEGGASRGKRQKHRRRHKRSDAGPSQENEPNPETDGAPGLQETPNVPAVGANAAPERKDPGHGAEPDLEAQSSAPTRPHLSLLLPIRPVISQTLSQTVFSKPKDRSPAPSLVPEAQRRGRITGPRRTNSLPANLNQMDQTYRTPGAIPPFNPILVNSTAKSGDGEKPEQSQRMSRTAAVILLLASTGLVALCAEFMVDSINEVVESNSGISEAFIGLILLPIVGNAAEHVTAVTVAMKNKMDLAIGVAVGSSIQIAIFVTPLIVLLGWILNKNMSLYFTLFETVSMFVSAFIVNFLVLDGRSNYLEGALLISAYVIIAVAAFFYPSSEERSAIGGGDADIEERAVRDVVAAIAAKWLA